ncbi:MAG: hypothetical protein K0R65_1760 [Crocinitomicaceae bacterium]|jgi:hypothetical protein|nr:hypothetical protein [Crocinitomicaceae bacterium]
MYSKFLLVFTCVLSGSLFGQKFATSPFSSYGLGEFGSFDNAIFVGYGNASAGVVDSLSLNYFNPSTYAFLGHGQPLFSTGISYKRSEFTENGANFSANLTGVNHFAMGIPFAKVCGIAFGLKPFSRVGYSIAENEIIGEDTLKYRYEGSGAINDAFVGFSLKVLDYKKHRIGVGSNLSYLFGSTTNERYSSLSSQEIGGLDYLNYRVKSVYYNIGLNYNVELSKNQFFSLGLTYNPAQELTAYKTDDLYFMGDVSDRNSVSDTISAFSEKSKITMPTIYDIGFSYRFRPKVDSSYNKERIFQLSVFGSYQVQNWSEYTAHFSNDTAARSMLNTSRISFGIEFIPHYNYLDRTKSIGYLSRIRYRAGFQTGTLPIERGGTQLTNSAVTFGLSFPIISQRSVSSLNLGVSLGSRGNGQSNSLNERFVGINFGVILAPGAYDKWFRKYKID